MIKFPFSTFIFFFFVLSFSLKGEAQDSSISRYSNEEIYSATKDVCIKIPAEWIIDPNHIIHESLQVGIFPSAKFNKMLSSVFRESLSLGIDMKYFSNSNMLKNLINNKYLYQALEECYGQAKQKDYIISYYQDIIQNSQKSGKFISAAAHVSSFFALGKIFKEIFALKAIASNISKINSEYLKWGQRLFMGTAAALIGHELYQARQAIYQSALIISSKQTQFLNHHPKLKKWLHDEMHSNNLAIDAEDLIENLKEDVRQFTEMTNTVIITRITDLARLRDELNDPQSRQEIEQAIAQLQRNLQN